ncbi:MAG: hypothetical protein JRE16_08675 [Deltaproteobacteria bacterium]|jgi:hypothetical protein|nr:hypothetical protein [Deltaproteobacteria bacterium]
MASFENHKFRVINGGKDKQNLFCEIPVTLVPDDFSPLDVDALVCEEDRYLIMTTSTDSQSIPEHPLRVINRAWQQQPLPLGSIHCRTGKPTRFLLVIHDLDRVPTCRPIWILAALANLRFQLSDHPHVRTIAMPLLGTRHGHLNISESFNLLRQAFTGANWPVKHLFLMVPRRSLDEVKQFVFRSSQ